MTILDLLRSNSLGVMFHAPSRYHVPQNGPRDAMLVDPECGFGMRVSLSDYAIDIDPANDELWRRDSERDTRALFERVFATMPRAGAPARKEPRTADAGWSPVIEMQRVRLGAGHGITVLHRMSYEPCHECVMGHLLVPLDGRLLELCLVQTAHVTGVRESALTAKALAARGEADAMTVVQGLGQRYFDDPAHDADFPQHPVSQLRAALRELVESGSLVVTSEPPDRPRTLEMDEIGLAVTPPPRFALVAGASDVVFRLSRLSFSSTDGLRLLSLARLRGMQVAGTAELTVLADQIVRTSAPTGATEVQIETYMLPGDGLPAARLQYTTDCPRHTLYHWRRLADGTPLMLTSNGEQQVPVEELRADLVALESSLRELEVEAPTEKPWWKFW